MNRKWIGLLLIIFGALLILVIVYFIFFYQFGNTNQETTEPVATTTTQINTFPTETDTTNQTTSTVISLPKTEMNSDDLKIMAASFAERFGSYSNQSNYENITDLKVFMSKKMQAWADNYISSQEKQYNQIYYGISTKAVSEEAKSFDNSTGQAEIIVATQRTESTATMNNSSSFYQDLLLIYTKEGGAWKVDNAVWQAKR